MNAHSSFSAPAEIHEFDGFLFDMDGTIIDSTDAIVKHWHKLGKQLGVDPNEILHSSHGRRSIDTLALYDKNLANWDYIKEMERVIPLEHGKDATEIAGARALLKQLGDAGAPWAIVTSGTRPLVEGWLDVMKFARPKNLVVAEDVMAGKPDPEGYLMGQMKLHAKPNSKMLVLEDAPSGIKAGKAAGFSVVALATTHEISRLKEAGADWIVKDLRSVTLKNWDNGLRQAKIEIKDALS